MDGIPVQLWREVIFYKVYATSLDTSVRGGSEYAPLFFSARLLWGAPSSNKKRRQSFTMRTFIRGGHHVCCDRLLQQETEHT